MAMMTLKPNSPSSKTIACSSWFSHILWAPSSIHELIKAKPSHLICITFIKLSSTFKTAVSVFHLQQYEFFSISKESMDSGSKCGSCGGLERPRNLQVELHNEIDAAASQDPSQVLFSGSFKTLFLILCFGFK